MIGLVKDDLLRQIVRVSLRFRPDPSVRRTKATSEKPQGRTPRAWAGIRSCWAYGDLVAARACRWRAAGAVVLRVPARAARPAAPLALADLSISIVVAVSTCSRVPVASASASPSFSGGGGLQMAWSVRPRARARVSRAAFTRTTGGASASLVKLVATSRASYTCAWQSAASDCFLDGERGLLRGRSAAVRAPPLLPTTPATRRQRNFLWYAKSCPCEPHPISGTAVC